MTFPRAIEHSKNYFVNIQLFGDRFIETDPSDLHYLATSFEINHSGGSKFIHQKGRAFASAIPTQPTNTITVDCIMTEADFAVITSAIIMEQQQILLSVGKLENLIIDNNILNEDSKLIFEALGYLSDARITARVGEYITVNFTMNADDINKIRTEDRFGTDPIPEFKA
jgi:hypothetical protein